jgi:hypothetical protein
MGDIIKFPTHVLEKERELRVLEFELKFREQKLDIAEKKIKNERMLFRTRFLLAFSIGLLVMGAIVLPLL